MPQKKYKDHLTDCINEISELILKNEKLKNKAIGNETIRFLIIETRLQSAYRMFFLLKENISNDRAETIVTI